MKVRREMMMVFQDPYASLNSRKRVGSIIGEALEVHKIGTAKENKARVQELLDVVGLNPEHYNRFPHEFSGGQRQRIGVARALAIRPKLIVCDEPVSALDVSVQAQILNLLKQLQRDFDLTYVFIAHDLDVVRHISDRVAVMYLGKLVETAPRPGALRAPAAPVYRRAALGRADPEPRRRPAPASRSCSRATSRAPSTRPAAAGSIPAARGSSRASATSPSRSSRPRTPGAGRRATTRSSAGRWPTCACPPTRSPRAHDAPAMTRAVLLAGLRRFAVLVVIAVVVTAVVSGVLAAATGQPVRRSVTVGLYLVGSVFVMMGFFAGNRPPVRADGEHAGLFGGLIPRGAARWMTPSERRDQISTSALFLTLGLALLAAGIAVDRRHTVG